MNQSVNPLLSILSEENKILDEVILNQVSFRQAVTQKNWKMLMSLSSSIGKLMDTFNSLDEKREELMQDKMESFEKDEKFIEFFTVLRGKLVKCRTENKALSDYISVTRNFVRKVIDNALPQTRNKVYTKSGIVQKQPQSVVVNTLF